MNTGNNLHRFFDGGDVVVQRQDGTDGTQRVTSFTADPAKRLSMVVKKGTLGSGALASRSTGDEVTITESDRLGRVIKTAVSSSSDPAFQVNGGNIRYVQLLLRHACLDTTKIYLRLVPGHLRQDYDNAMPPLLPEGVPGGGSLAVGPR